MTITGGDPRARTRRSAKPESRIAVQRRAGAGMRPSLSPSRQMASTRQKGRAPGGSTDSAMACHVLRSVESADRKRSVNSTHPPQNPKSHGDVLTAISDGMVALLKEFYGRGPTRAKSYYEDDLVVCVLRGGFSRVEQTLLDGGRGAAVIQQRMEFQKSCGTGLRASSKTRRAGP